MHSKWGYFYKCQWQNVRLSREILASPCTLPLRSAVYFLIPNIFLGWYFYCFLLDDLWLLNILTPPTFSHFPVAQYDSFTWCSAENHKLSACACFDTILERPSVLITSRRLTARDSEKISNLGIGKREQQTNGLWKVENDGRESNFHPSEC